MLFLLVLLGVRVKASSDVGRTVGFRRDGLDVGEVAFELPPSVYAIAGLSLTWKFLNIVASSIPPCP